MRYANITSIPSSYIGAFFSSLEDASPPSEDALSHRRGRVAQLAMTRRPLDSVRVSTGLWTCFHWPVDVFPQASGNASTGQWTTTEWARLINYPTAKFFHLKYKKSINYYHK